ncbi:aminoglycoside phosphotransferase family protein [Virgibacillus pantothenticus]|uniref:aminoglycoside phosphotransferase family protein n=1 Tax=Virgibacillus pantothenticus TaxID=1473 RepID=UPI002014BB1B|nr:aminoglycoside phosphotransferase family protein [Virgibacillus pantothenticus]
MKINSIAYIPLFEQATTIKKLNKGFSFDQKYVIDDQYLVRVFSDDHIEKREEEFQTLAKLRSLSKAIPEAIEFNTVKELGIAYMILSFMPGEDGEATLQKLATDAQYAAGYSAGEELNKLHAYPAPKDMEPWYDLKKRKSDDYLQQLTLLNIDPKVENTLVHYIREHEHIMKGRPNRFQHDDFHPANLLIHNRRFSGIIDFQRMDWGDPIHDLQKLGFFSSRISIPFTQGIVDGYHRNMKVDEGFWELYTLYSAMHLVSALVWGKKMGTFERMRSYSMNVLEDHDFFTKTVPNWYEK